MRRTLGWFGAAGLALLALPGLAADAEKKPKVTFAAETETKLADLFKKIGEAKLKVWAEQAKREIDDVAKVTGLGEEGRAALAEPARQAAEQSLAGWITKMDASFRTSVQQNNGLMEEMFGQMETQIDAYARSDFFGDHTRPKEQAVWSEAMKRVLSAEQWAAWEKAQAERKAVLDQQIAESLERPAERAREQQRVALARKSAEIANRLSLAKERVAQLEELVKKVTESAVERWRKKATRMVAAMEEPQRTDVLKRGNLFFSVDEGDTEKLHQDWEEGLATVLTPEERKQQAELLAAQKARRIEAMGRVFVAELDAVVAFTASQRERLRPLAEKLVQDQAALFPEGGGETYANFGAQTFFNAAASAKEAEVREILDETQWKRWQQAPKAAPGRPRPVRLIAGMNTFSKPAKPVPPSSEPEEVENAIADYLHEKTNEERQRQAGQWVLRAEDVARVAALAPVVAGRLQTAARGAVEEALAAWKVDAESNVRAQLGEVAPQNVRQRLASMGTYYFSRNSGPTELAKKLWDKTLETEVPEAQRAAWQKEVEARAAFREQTIAASVVAEFARRQPLAPAAWEKLEPIVAKVVKDYAPDIASMFGSGNSTPWYLQHYTMLLPLMAVPEAELKAILGEGAWTAWTKSEGYSNTASYWENVQQNHEQRKKRAKP